MEPYLSLAYKQLNLLTTLLGDDIAGWAKICASYSLWKGCVFDPQILSDDAHSDGIIAKRKQKSTETPRSHTASRYFFTTGAVKQCEISATTL
jgi:hypothetical protein